MKLKFDNIFESFIDDPVKAREASDRANVLAVVRELMVACKWDVKDKISISVDENSIVISRAGSEPKYTLTELLEKSGSKAG